MISNIADMLDGLDLFSDFSYSELKTIGRFVAYQPMKQGEVVFNEGDPGNYMLILVDGKLSIFKGGESGRHLLCYEGRGRIVGEMSLLDHELRSASCVAESDCELLTLSSEGLERMAVEHPVLAYRFMSRLARLLSKRLRKTSGMLVEFLEH